MTTNTIAEPIGQFWEWRGQKVYYVQAGGEHRGYPPLLLVHGFGASTDHWRKNIADLQQDFQVWAIDLIGFGRSQKPNWQYSGALWRDQLVDFIQEKIGQPVVLAGNSLGGYACLCVGASQPELVKGIVLLNSAGPFTDTTPLGAKPVSPWQRVLRQLGQQILKQKWANYLLFQWVRRKENIRKTLCQVYLDKTAVTDRLVEEIYAPSCDQGAAEVFASVFSTPQGAKVDELLTQMSCPLLLLWGEADPWMDTHTRSRKFHQYYAQITEHFLQAGHCPHDERPDVVNPLVRNWVKQISAS
ncbi:MAG: alpha/beta fold hydrolase [Pseudanabaenaceae cyanobacterium]